MIDILDISIEVLGRLSRMDYEKDGGNSLEKLIFPFKIQANGEKHVNRISEQELRLIFIEEFKSKYPHLFYSIETPTLGKFKFRGETLKTDEGRSASHDLCIYERNSGEYKRILNIEFKHRNSKAKNTEKDILKLMCEVQNGVFIHLLDSTDEGTLDSVFKKLYKSFFDYQLFWNDEIKSIQLVILSLKQKKLIYSCIHKTNLNDLKDIFYIESGYGNMNNFKGNNWRVEEFKEIVIKQP